MTVWVTEFTEWDIGMQGVIYATEELLMRDGDQAIKDYCHDEYNSYQEAIDEGLITVEAVDIIDE